MLGPRNTMKTLFFFLCALSSVTAFVPLQSSHGIVTTTTTTTLGLFGGPKKGGASNTKPKFNPQTQKWERAANDDGEYPYDAIGSLLRQGPAPYLKRTFQKDDYEQAILKYMATDNVGRAEATGNMDAFFNNAQDWQFQKLAEKRGAPKVDYTYLSKKQAALTVIWAVFITPLTFSVLKDTATQFMSH